MARHSAPPFWPDHNWLWELIDGLPDDDIIKVVTQCSRSDANVSERYYQIMLIILMEMAKKAAVNRGLPPPPGQHW